MCNQDKHLYEAQEENLSKQSAVLIDFLQRSGVMQDKSVEDEQVRKKRKEISQKQFHNTQLLLEQYNLILWVLECLPTELPQELSMRTKDLDALIQRIDVELCLENKRLEGRMRAVIKTKYLVERIQEALALLRKRPGTGERLYQVIYYTYIDLERRSLVQLMEKLDMSSRTYYRLRKEAINIISIRLWSSPQGDVDTWLEVLSLLEEF